MSKVLKVDLSKPDSDALSTIAHEIIHGKVVIYPTDTIYGIGVDACNPEAVERVFQVKQRDPAKPLLVLVNSVEMAAQIAASIPPAALPLIEKFWPGPLTIIFKAGPAWTSKLTAGGGTIGIRYPRHEFCLKILELCRRPITSTSANISGEKEPRTVRDVVESFESKVDLIVDAGDLPSEKPSTIVDMTGSAPRLVREGALRREALEPFFIAEITS